jgi:putative endonuclease
LFEFHRRFRSLDPSAQASRPCPLAFARQALQARKKLRSRAAAKNGLVMHCVYVLRSVSDDGLYVGYSANLRRRFAQHNEGSALATSHRGPWKLIYYEAYVEQADALGREEYLKSGGGRRFLRAQLKRYLKKYPLRAAA